MRVCEECLQPLREGRCADHPFTRPLDLDNPDDRELLATLRGLRADRRSQSLIMMAPLVLTGGLTAGLFLLFEMALLNSFVWAMGILLFAVAILLPVLPIMWILGFLSRDLVVSLGRRLGWWLPEDVGLLPEEPVLDPIRSAEQARAVRVAHRCARAPQSVGPRFLH